MKPRRGYTAEDYWNRPVSGFGDPRAGICLIGLAPGAHGANRTGRPFTGDGAGDFMYPLLYLAGLANQAVAEHRGDGLELSNLYITNAVKCLPPENQPKGVEFENCRGYLEDELESLERLRVLITLGTGAHKSVLHLLKARGEIERLADLPFGHGACFALPEGRWLIGCYHTSRYNVQTGRIDERMFLDVVDKALLLVSAEDSG
ncbi:MAG TPA: uracil-DNA glycosylase [Desulfosarcina sp.]|nr:uracil-DNA glycosylase [Desulfosarcina sp.]